MANIPSRATLALTLFLMGALLLANPLSASGGSGSISWSDDVTGTTTKTGSVFGTKCGSGSANAAEEASVLPLMNGWAGSAASADFTFLSPAATPADNASGDSAVITFPGVSDVTVTVSRRQVPAADATNPTSGSFGALSNNAVFSDAARLQDCAPRPADLTSAPAGMTLASGSSFSGLNAAASRATFWNATSFPAGNQLDGALFQFSRPVGAFGLWFGDLETRHPVADDPFGAALAIVKLMDSTGAVIQSIEITPDENPTDDTNCGGAVQTTDNLGCGNQSTRFIGFVEPTQSVASMLVIVGDDDSCDQARQCDGITEYLSWIGPMLAEPQPDLTITKSLVTAPEAPGDDAVWMLSVSNAGARSAAAGWTVADIVGGGLSNLVLTGNGAEVDCTPGTSCIGLVPILPTESVQITATATHDAAAGTSVDNVAFVTPLPADVPELVPVGTPPAPGDDTSNTATNNDAHTSHEIEIVPDTTTTSTTTTVASTTTTAPTNSTTSAPTTTMASTSSTTSSTMAPTTTTTTTAVPTTTTTTQKASVNGDSVNTPTTTTPELAFTGSPTTNRAMFGIALLLFGVALLLTADRKPALIKAMTPGRR